MKNTNEMELIFDSKSVNEGFARVSVAAFMTQLNPTLEEVADVKTAVSEAVTNAIIHGYEKRVDKITIHCRLEEHTLYIEVRDYGKGIEDVEKAMQPLFTTKPELERSGGILFYGGIHGCHFRGIEGGRGNHCKNAKRNRKR